MPTNRTLCFASGCAVTALTSIALGLGLGLGPLDPPSGPVTDTSPSLADLSAQIAALSGTLGAPGIPAETFETVFLEGSELPQNSTVQAISGRVYLRSVIVANGQVRVLDGQDNTVAVWSAASTTSDSTGQVGGNQMDLGVFFDDGVRIRRTSNFNVALTLVFARVPAP